MSDIAHIKGKTTFLGVNDIGQAGSHSSHDGIIFPTRIAFPLVANTPVQLENIPSTYICVQNPIGNDPIYVATIGDQSPYIDKAYPGDYRGAIVYEGVTMSFDVSNAALLQVVGTPQQSFQYWAYPRVTTEVPISNTTPPSPDIIPPTITAPTTPVNGSVSQATSTSIFAIFSEPLDPDSVNSLTVLISPSVAGSVYVDAGNPAKIGFAPNANLNTSTTYTITFKGTGANRIKDVMQNTLVGDQTFSFTTAAAPPPPDTTPPTVVSTVPASAATNVSLSVTPTITFSEPMLAASITTSTVTLLNDLSIAVPSVVTLSADKLTATITPNAALTNAKTYTIRITTGVTDLAGNHLATTFNSTFTTNVVLTLVYNVAATSSNSNLYNTYKTQVGLYCATTSSLMFGIKPKKFVVTLKKTGSPTGNIYCKIVDHTKDAGAPGQVLATIGTPINIATLTTSDGTYTFEDVTNTIALSTTNVLVIEFAGGDSSNYLNFKRDSSGTYDGTNTVIEWNDGTGWAGNTAIDVAGQIYA